MNLNGWQNKYSRLDEEGVCRAKELRSLRDKMHRSSCTKEQELLQCEIQELREEHMFQKLVSKCHLMRKDIRKLLGEGAFVTPPWCQRLLKFNSIKLLLCQSAHSGFTSIRCWLLIRSQTVKSSWQRSISLGRAVRISRCVQHGWCRFMHSTSHKDKVITGVVCPNTCG